MKTDKKTDCGASENDRENIEKIASGVNGMKEVHAIRTRKIGPSIYLEWFMEYENEYKHVKRHSSMGVA